MAKKEDKQLVVVNSFEDQLSKIPDVIKTEKDALAATDLLLKARKLFTKIEEKRKERTAPANETIKIINADYKQFLEPLKKIEDKIKGALEDYADRKTEEDLIRLAEVRESTGEKLLDIPVGISSFPSPEGEVRFRKGFKVIITDEAKVPRKYKVTSIDMKAIQKEVDDNDGVVKIAGIEVKPSTSAAIYTSKE